MPEAELIDHAGLDSAVYLRIYLLWHRARKSSGYWNVIYIHMFVLCSGCFWIQFMKIMPILKQTLPDLESDDGDGFFPMVLVQIPMCNEMEGNTCVSI
ncbi:hypothetical protein L6452_20824 [Arctium lappa]|uniref:Uncharacterized protein n=1 Tax=Arctium lappa TaxID=4217 RepID=A0ACB9BD94_ARCLA|nr:hypothetical protein L6452_20824 [Arctium lappa]